ncbi:hypothetical protein HMPREF9444_01944 [Succinatimonas hippei YIT 12066]|uniref:Uncharacterized protein n=1 Tax=Succinatimonas hippei (strain DSM 22608 / JCM 16073 / KCTC 15190 / YIT 12066) TaxID=762983 RepID=E8LMF6_SUCHY|nr:hypothetical protein HMPREF9444_01944 [Succinatimonas hippei YIT 12066]
MTADKKNRVKLNELFFAGHYYITDIASFLYVKGYRLKIIVVLRFEI